MSYSIHLLHLRGRALVADFDRAKRPFLLLFGLLARPPFLARFCQLLFSARQFGFD
jgi:hypothetical protein